jgi:hypothetical protein
VLEELLPMGGRPVDDQDGCVAGRARGARNRPPSIPGIRRALQWAAEADIDPVSLYRFAVGIYERLDRERRHAHPEWSWPAPPFEAVEPVTWPPLKPELHRSIHLLSVCAALWAETDERQRIERLRAVLARAQSRGLAPEALYDGLPFASGAKSGS